MRLSEMLRVHIQLPLRVKLGFARRGRLRERTVSPIHPHTLPPAKQSFAPKGIPKQSLGTRGEFAKARYGELRVAPTGDSVLTGLRDAQFQPLGTP